ncbi:MAG: aminopeptidase [Myxococcota bacterium]
MLVLAPGCYLAHVAGGQLDLLRAREPIDRVLEDPATPGEVRDRLALVQRVRAYAAALGLAVEGQYTQYAAWPGDRLVTTIVATRPREVDAAGFWFPIVGTVPYKGYFDTARARAEAERLRADGFDVCEVPVRAYSTLGWFGDPVTGPMLRQDAPDLVETVLHELFHATVFVASNAEFNEGLASFVGQEARVRFYAGEEGEPGAHRQRREIEARRRIGVELERTRAEVADLYARADVELEGARAGIEAATRERLRALGPDASYAAIAQSVRLNDACLALSATYAGDIARYGQVLAALDGDLGAFVVRAREAADSAEPGAHFFRDTP